MPYNPKSKENLIPAKKGDVRNPYGNRNRTKHISTWIQELMHDEDFVATVREGLQIKEYKGAPIKAIVRAQMNLAVQGDTKAFDALAKYGWKPQMEQEITVTHKFEDMDDEELERAIQARQDRAA